MAEPSLKPCKPWFFHLKNQGNVWSWFAETAKICIMLDFRCTMSNK